MIIDPNEMNNAPNFVNEQDAAKWLEGKPNRREIIAEIKRMREGVIEASNNEFMKIGQTLSKLVGMVRIKGIELESLVESLDKAAPGFREGYITEFNRQFDFVQFVEGFIEQGEHSEKPIREKIDIIRSWNAVETNVPIKGNKFIIRKQIEVSAAEFTPEELKALEEEFDTQFTPMPVTQSEVTNG